MDLPGMWDHSDLEGGESDVLGQVTAQEWDDAEFHEEPDIDEATETISEGEQE